MRLNKISGYLACAAVLMTATSCEKNFLDRQPLTSITEENFFNTPADLDTYVNGIVNAMQSGGVYDDVSSDNTSIYLAGSTHISMLSGTITPANIGGWSDWGNLRRINFLLDNAGKATGDAAAIRSSIGVARYFRARFYINKIKQYSDVPWFSHAMTSEDPDIYKAKDPRALVADSVLADLEYAAANVTATKGNKTRIHRWVAKSELARFCLYEGTYRKYHAEINLTGDADRFLTRAAEVSKDIMDNGGFSISGNDATAYRNLFISTALDGNPEIIQWFQSSKELNVANNTHTVLGYQWGISRNLMETFLMKDGTPFTQTPGYATKQLTQVFANRDPRLAEVIATPGFETVPGQGAYLIKPSTGGYDQIKFYPRDPALRGGWVLNYTSLPIYRFAETLLNYAEARAELNLITQADLDLTVNKLRARVGMPLISLATANSVIDPVLAAYYPNVTGANRGALLEIRRERRVELACEGFRYDDLKRWFAGQHFADPQQGIYLPGLGAFDVTGDGIADIAIVPTNSSPITAVAGSTLPADISKIVKYPLDDRNANYALSNGTSGYLVFKTDQQTPKSFISPKYYYQPIPASQIVLNPKLAQPIGWQ